MKLVSYLVWVTFAMLLLLLAGCSSTPKPPIATMSLNVQQNINQYSTESTKPDARPVVIRVFELNSLAAFNTADFFSLFNNYSETLGTELLNNSEEFQLSPGKKLKFNRTLNFDTRYIGVVSAFRDLEHAQWRAATAVPQNEKAPEIYVLLDGNKVMIGAKPACGFFCQLWSPKAPAGSLYEIIEPNTQ